MVFVSGCGGTGDSTRAAASPAASPSSAASFPSSPPTAARCAGKVLDHRDIQHPNLGAVRVFLVRRPASQEPSGCVAAVTGGGNVLASTDVDVHDEKSLRFADPATDATKNTFVIYNPGRYDGVLALVPNAGGFEDIGWSNPDDHYSGGKFAYYNAKLVGPGADGRYTITRYENSCDPSCAEGVTAEVTLRWKGQEYQPAE
ncbi:hypothetical protein [Spongiactinospora sp. 9N601]|uniref:hypothetical protein n=1 Tax=Spongiactinospora sp. 9N601 TaxID=3375149 RepID=UPI0037AFDC98